MFDSLTQKKQGKQGRRWVVFVLGSAAVNLIVVAAAWYLIPRDPIAPSHAEVPITFASRVESAPVDEAPEPVQAPPPELVAVAVAPQGGGGGSRMRGLLEAPAVLPSAPPSAADPVRPPGWESVGGQGGGTAGIAAQPETPPAVEAPGPSRRIVQITEKVDPPRPDPGNRMPRYPEAARRAGVEGLVEIKVVVDESGGTSVVKVHEGTEPFLTAVMEVLPEWRFRPARLDGESVAVARVVRVPFRLNR